MKLVRITTETHQQAKVLAAQTSKTLDVVLGEAMTLYAGLHDPAVAKFFRTSEPPEDDALAPSNTLSETEGERP